MKNRTKKSKAVEKRKSEFYHVRFHPDCSIGLMASEVATREQDGLINRSQKHYSKTYREIFKENIVTFFNILLFIIAIALILVGSYKSLFFMVIQFANIVIGIFQDIRAKKTIDRLRLVTAPNATAIRDAREVTIPSDKIVLDDIIILTAGKQISTDAIVRQGTIEVNESLLTGEAIAVKKKVGDMVYAGSYVTSGNATVQVDKIGDENYAQQLQKKAKVLAKPKSELLQSLNFIFRIIGFIIIPFAIMMVIGNFLQIRNDASFTSIEKVRQIVASTAGSLVAMIPAGMFLLTSITLYTGVLRLGKKKTLVQELYSIEMLARVDTLCLDKTGTLTDGTMTVEDVIIFDAYQSIDIDTLMGSYLKAVKDGNQTAIAMKNRFPLNNVFQATDVLPFSSERKCSVVTFKGKGTYLFGAPEYVYKGKDRTILKMVRDYVSKGTRVLMIAYSREKIKGDKVPQETDPIALFILHDHIREDAYDTINWFRNNEVDVKIISGDNPVSVAEIARLVGVETAHQYISLEGMSLEEVESVARDYTVFGRVSPEQKATLISTLRKHNRTVAMIGDGVNDILSLKQADCSIAMAAGAEAARDVAHLVLMDSNFSVLPDIVAEGRRAISNLQNVSSLFLVKTTFSILFSLIWLVVMFVVPGNTRTYPFEPQHLYIWEMLAIGIAAFFMALQPNKKLIKGNFVANVVQKALPGGIVITLAVSTFFIFQTFNLFGCGTDATQTIPVAVTCSCLTMYVLSFVILFRICLPFNKYRTVVYVSLLALAIIALIISELTGWNVFSISIRSLSKEAIQGLLLVIGLALPIYIGADRAFKLLTLKRK